MSQVTEKTTKAQSGPQTKASAQNATKEAQEKHYLEVHLNDDYEDIADMLMSGPTSPWQFGLFDPNSPPTETFEKGIRWQLASKDDIHPSSRQFLDQQQVAGYGDAVVITGQILWKVDKDAYMRKQMKFRDGSYLNMEEVLSREMTEHGLPMKGGFGKPDGL